MSTRSITVIMNDENTAEQCRFYRHWDGYPTGHGDDLAECLRKIKLTNGYTGDQERSKFANGMGNLAAMVIAEMENQGHDIHILPPGVGDMWEEYTYTVRPAKPQRMDLNFEKGVGFVIEVWDGEKLYTSTPEGFDGKKVENFFSVDYT